MLLGWTDISIPTKQPGQIADSRLRNLDILRGLSAFAIALGHLLYVPTSVSLMNQYGFSSFQYDFTNFTQYINPNGSSRIFLEYNPSFTFSHINFFM